MGLCVIKMRDKFHVPVCPGVSLVTVQGREAGIIAKRHHVCVIGRFQVFEGIIIQFHAFPAEPGSA